jgi:hypothetical protein
MNNVPTEIFQYIMSISRILLLLVKICQISPFYSDDPTYKGFSEWLPYFNNVQGARELIKNQEESVRYIICTCELYTAPCIMFWKRAYPLLGQVGVGPWNSEAVRHERELSNAGR